MTAETFGHYRLISLLGVGGMGEVWRAVDSRKDREVALKVLGPWLAADPEYSRRFRREAALAARLTAPNIIPIHDYGEIDGRLYIEMPLITGKDLAALLAEEGPLPAARLVGIIEQLADALDVAHHAGLVHRDVKPSNVLVAGGGARDFAYLIDFGIANAAGSTTITPVGAIAGSPTYVAPERFEGGGDGRSDVYALTCVLYEALVGEPPFSAPPGAHSLGFYLNAHQNLPVPRPSQHRRGIPVAVDAVIARGMAKRPDDRYLTAGDLAAAVRAALVPVSGRDSGEEFVDATPLPAPSVMSIGEGVRSATASVVASGDCHPAAVPERDGPWPNPLPVGSWEPSPARGARRNRPLSLVAAALVVAIVAILSINDGISPRTAPDTASTQPFKELRLTHDDPTVFAVATAQLNGRPVVLAGDGQRVRVWDLASGVQIGSPIVGHGRRVKAVATAQLAGRTVVISGSDETVRLWDLASGAPIGHPLVGHTDSVFAVATTQLDGRAVVVSGGQDEAVRVWDLATGAPIGGPLIGHTSFVFSVATAELNGRPVVISGGGDGTVRVWDLASGAPIGSPLTGHADVVYAVATSQLDGRSVVVTGNEDGTVRVWDLASGAPIGAPLAGHTGAVLDIAVDELDGRPIVISGGQDRTVRVWDLASGAPIGIPFTGHTDSVYGLETAQLGGRSVVISGGGDRTVRTWDLAART